MHERLKEFHEAAFKLILRRVIVLLGRHVHADRDPMHRLPFRQAEILWVWRDFSRLGSHVFVVGVSDVRCVLGRDGFCVVIRALFLAPSSSIRLGHFRVPRRSIVAVVRRQFLFLLFFFLGVAEAALDGALLGRQLNLFISKEGFDGRLVVGRILVIVLVDRFR